MPEPLSCRETRLARLDITANRQSTTAKISNITTILVFIMQVSHDRPEL
jgi:hypothetical protein